MQISPVKIGTRSSALALAQAHQLRNALLQAHNLPPEAVEIVPMSSKGDRILDRSLESFGGKGLFTQEIEEALLQGQLDIGVHSAKDMPAILPGGLYLSAFLKREDPRDAFIGREAARLAELPPGAKIGTSSIRRQALLRRLRPDLEICLLRGNVQTRLEKLRQGAADGTFLAYAGLKRLGLTAQATEILAAEQFVPAPAQGVICTESRIGDRAINALLAPLNDDETALTTQAERGFMAALDGSCRTPLGAYAVLQGQNLHLHGLIITPNGKICHEIRRNAPAAQAAELGRQAAQALRSEAGSAFFAGWR